MTKDTLFHLLDTITPPDSIVRRLNTPQWRFWCKEKHIKGNDVFLHLREFIERRTKKSETKIRENAYVVFAKLLGKSFDSEHCQFFIDHLNVETNKYTLDTILSGIAQLPLPEDIDISPIVACSKSDKWLVRHSAITALGKSNTNASRETVRYWVRQENERQYEFEIVYANAALGYIGTPEDIALLERHIHSRIHDVKDSAIYAINNIKQRFDMPHDTL